MPFPTVWFSRAQAMDRISGNISGARIYGGAGTDTFQHFGFGGAPAKFSDFSISQLGLGFSVQVNGQNQYYLESVEQIQVGLDIYGYNAADSTWEKIGGPLSTDAIVYGTQYSDNFVSAPYVMAREFLLGGGDDRITLSGMDIQGQTVTVRGGVGNDTIIGPTGMFAGGVPMSYATTLFGDDGNDNISGGRTADTLHGGAGNDTLSGGLGVDTLTGGSGADNFVFQTRSGSASGSPSSGNDIITDFEVGIDSIATISSLPGGGQISSVVQNATGTAVTILEVGTIQLQGVFGITADDLFV